MTLPPAIVVHSLRHIRAALAAASAAGGPVLLLSARGAALHGGAGWWRAMIAAAQPPPGCPDALDCADNPARAIEALGLGCGLVVLMPQVPAWADIAQRAAARGATLLPTRPPALDLACPDAPRCLYGWLSQA